MDTSSLSQVKAKFNTSHVSPGDTVKVSFKIREANRERLQTFSGLIISVKKGAGGGNFTIRRVTSGIGVEHTFPFASPLLDKIEVVRHGKVRRAKLYYMRELSAKEARLKERREKVGAGSIELADEVEEAEDTEQVEITDEVEEAEDTEQVEIADEVGKNKKVEQIEEG